MKPTLTLLTILLLASPAGLHAATMHLIEPLDHQVIQRSSQAVGTVRVRGTLTDFDLRPEKLEMRIVVDGKAGSWRSLDAKITAAGFDGTLEVPAGGWHQLEVRALRNDQVVAGTSVEHVGVGEVFVVAGQSNSANFGEEKQKPQTGRVATFTGDRWQIADDPQPGAGGKGGSFMPPLGDEIVRRFNVPVGFIACGIGATSVREWQSKGTTFSNPPTLLGRVEKLSTGRWTSKGDAFAIFVMRMKQPGLRGFRAVLWHQGESDANQSDPACTLPGKVYREYLTNLIRESRREIGWDAPWFVAQASYHVPGDEGSDDIRAAQTSLWKDGVALEGPDSDAIKGRFREREGKGVHFSGEGLRVHGVKWAEKVIPWLERECTLKLPAMFSDRMVLQREQPVPVWGWSVPGDEITVYFAGQSKTAVADITGKWIVRLDAMKANTHPQAMNLVSKFGAPTKIGDVLIGDVWLCAGQSNMAMTVDGKTGWLHVGGIANAKKVVRESSNSQVRQFLVNWSTSTRPQANCTGKWMVAEPEATAEFSATGYFFARELQQKLKVPVGILNASFGGSTVEGWTSREALAKESDAEFFAKVDKALIDYENHDQLLVDYVATLNKWETANGRVDPHGNGDDAAYAAANTETSDWRKVTIPASFAQVGLKDGGVIWLRKEIDVPTELGTAWRLDFPACRAFSAIYLNGEKIFEATPANGLASRASRPTIGKGIAKPGKNSLTIKLHGYVGNSGITSGVFAVVPFNPKFAAIPLRGEWLLKAEKAFPPLPNTAEKTPVFPEKGTLHWMPGTTHFNAMLHPLIPFAIRGAAWYQGESNVGNARYAQHLRILVDDWRRRWGSGDFPFYSCQLPGFGPRTMKLGDSNWAECREMQTAVLDLPNTGLVNLIDTCEDGDLHPLNKEDVGKRLALVALANTYDIKELAWSGPVYDSVKFTEEKAIVTFKQVGEGLAARRLPATYHPNLRKPELEPKLLELPNPGSELQGFVICDSSKKWLPAEAKIERDTVIVWSPEVRNPIAVRYAWADHPVANLYNQAGLPAFPFRTDKFPGLSKKN